jgi:hypothetical protein
MNRSDLAELEAYNRRGYGAVIPALLLTVSLIGLVVISFLVIRAITAPTREIGTAMEEGR